MKTNGNDQKIGEYYIGLDVGTNSVGWAVTGTDYRVLRFHGKHMWGARLFEEAQGASDRRTHRTMRRRLQRRRQRLTILEALFAKEINRIDPDFYVRLHESDLWQDDKKTGGKFSLFNDPAYTDKDYHKSYPTIYHLRSELAHSAEPHDVRLVFLALHHLMKYRGHFLEQGDSPNEIVTVEQAWANLVQMAETQYALSLAPADQSAFTDALKAELGITAKKNALKAALGKQEAGDEQPDPYLLCDLLAGAKVRMDKLFNDDGLKDGELGTVSLKDDLDDKADLIHDTLGEHAELLYAAKDVFDAARLTKILGAHQYICDAKKALYKQNGADLRALKTYVKTVCPEKKRLVFTERKDKLNNYPAYSQYRAESGDYCCTQEEFCKFLEAVLPSAESAEAIKDIMQKIKDRSFLPKLRGTENGVIPYQLQKRELEVILRNASAYLPFLKEKDADGFTVADKIVKTFEFRLPYYIGPLNADSPYSWCVRFAGKENDEVKPWNLESVIDTERTAERFIGNLIGLCQYTAEPVLPKDSLLYGEYMLRNELNPLRVNGEPLPHDVREQMIRDLFVDSRKRVTKKGIREYLISRGLIGRKDEVTGVDDRIKTVLKSRHDFARFLDRTGDYALAEQIIRSIVVFGEDKKMLRRWLKKNVPDLEEDDLRYFCKLKYEDWGNLSETFLTGIYTPVEYGEAKSVMDMLRETNLNLMQLLSKEYDFSKHAAEHRNEVLGNNRSLEQRLDDLYAAPAVRRAIRQTLRIVDEIVDIRKAAPKKIFIEMARGDKNEVLKKRTESRKEKLTALYSNCKEQSRKLATQLEQEDDNSLRSDKLYLYYLQLGKCMYSGEPIDLEALLQGKNYDIDHIYPRSRIKDDSLDNRVLVKNTLNREKTNEYPIKQEIRDRMKATWAAMKQYGLISEKKYDRLTRRNQLTEQELSDFVARQLTQTRQSTKALATILGETYSLSRLVYSKAGNVAEFRQKYGLVKCREINDLHHAKDAYLNIVVGNVYATRFTDQFFRNIQNEEYSINVDAIFEHNVPGAWNAKRSITTVKDMVRRNDPIVTRMPRDSISGALMNKVQQQKAREGQLAKKAGMDILRYGGYRDLTGAYFCVIESTERKKRVRMIEPILNLDRKDYEKDPITFWKSKGKIDPVILVRKICVNSIIEINGIRLYITSRSEPNIKYQLAEELYVNDEYAQLIKNIVKYVDRCQAKKAELPITTYDRIDSAKLLALYSEFEIKSQRYASVFEGTPLHEVLANGKQLFVALTILEQCKTILEILNVFQCNALRGNLLSIGGKKEVGSIRKSKNISKMETVTVINQSTTGLYEYRVDLLGSV